MKNTRWDLKKTREVETNLQVDKDILSILAARGITKKEDIVNFLVPKLENLTSPLLLQDMEKARDRVIQAINKNEKICIYGDYDVDGITSTSILYLGLKELGVTNITYYIPVRDEGYGLNNEALDSIKADGVDLVITVDCGITSYKEIEHANAIGLEVVITDHHNLLNPVVPNAYAVVNPKRPENKYGFNDLAGVGTAFMLLISIFDEYGKMDDAFEYIDLVSLGTIADVVSLVDQNRIIVKYGLKKLSSTKNLGLKILCNKLFGPKEEGYEYSSGDISFGLCPVFNAAGRMKDAKLVVKLLISNNEREIEVIINDLLSKNAQRKELQNQIYEVAKKELEDVDDYVLISSSPNYHHGLIGIVAAKIVDEYYKPSIILEEKPDEGIAVASCRSIANFDITKALQYCGNLLVKFGGHKGAAGFTIQISKIEEFKKKINEYAKKNLKEEDFCKVIEIDKVIPINKVSYEFFKTLELLKPFGFGNPTPILLTKNVIVENVKQIGEKKNHINFDISQKGYVSKGAVWFFRGDMYDELKKNVFFDIVYKINVSDYKGRYYTKIYVEDMKESLLKEDKFSYLNSLYKTSFPIKSIFYTQKDMSLDDELTLSYDFDRVSVYRKREYIARLDYNISRLLIQAKSFYNFNYKLKIESINSLDGVTNVEIILMREYDFLSYKKNDKNLFNYIKKYLIQDREYSSINKLILSSLFKDNKSVLVSGMNIKGDIKFKPKFALNAIQTFAIFVYKMYGVKARLITKDKSLKDDNILKFFTTKDESPYVILDKNSSDVEFEQDKVKLEILLDDSVEEVEGLHSIHFDIHIPSNVLKANKSNVEKYGIDSVYLESLPNSEKVTLKSKLYEGNVILSDDSIMEII